MTQLSATVEAALWRQVLHGDALLQAYFAAPVACHGALLMTCEEDDTFNLALVDNVPPVEADIALAAIVSHYRQWRATPRVRLTPCSAPDWPARLAAAGFFETSERRRFWIAPRSVPVTTPKEIVVARVTTREEADRFSAIQAAAFGLPAEVQEWDRQLARRHLRAGDVSYYLGRRGGRAEGAGAMMPLANGTVGLWGLATFPAARHRGVGMALLARMIDDALAIADGPVFFTTAWNNPIEIVYERLGCVPLFRARTFASGRRRRRADLAGE